MYAGHFAVALLFHSYFPEINSFLFTFGVGLLDITFGMLAYFGIEGLTVNPNAGLLGVDLHCPFSHSLAGSFFISFLWGCMSMNGDLFLPLFLSSFSHFIQDWFVHNRDLELYPKSKIFIGGTGWWSKYPRGTYYFELILCACCSIGTLRKNSNSLSFNMNGICLSLSIFYVFYLHYQRRAAASGQLAHMVKTIPQEKQGPMLFRAFMKSFIMPAVILGTLLYF
ncbi:unnamed protein product [Didymodactylos carnosus]|uniref:Metal-dependent hydrolase n=1 Tax=Didymodactylos carnosus TaxID=1234261 RepID=A0A814WF39_9BILA|nr:unnamed protein product [Didymodactylos carnosus]CAF1470443.1 unnamed protein product [Didymodactylos carnosus]CAF3965049.1 unnamed protein product [Didymodactylos carnosus]CAF4262477.1 unnamed protein product [Didymodactylos carnosus]